MAVYMMLAILPMVLGFVFSPMDKQGKTKKVFYAICGAVMLFVLGCRHYNLGSVDTAGYYARMKNAISCETWEQFYNPELYEAGFQMFIYALSRVFKHPQWLLVVTSLIYIISIFYFVDRNTDEIPLSITLYITLGIMLFHLQGMRQAIAMCICLFAYEQAKRKNLVKFLLLVLLATTFHKTAIIFLCVYLFANLKVRWQNVLFMSIVFASCIIFSNRLVVFANELFGKEYSGTVDKGGFVAVAIYVITLIICLLCCVSNRKNFHHASLIFITMAGTATYIMRYTGVAIAERISFYFIFAQLALLPNIVKFFTKKDWIVIRMIIAVLAVALMAYRLNGSEFVPYMFFWDNY